MYIVPWRKKTGYNKKGLPSEALFRNITTSQPQPTSNNPF
jgi:hypothetical protein